MWKKTKRKLADLIRSASFTEVGVALDYSATGKLGMNVRECMIFLDEVIKEIEKAISGNVEIGDAELAWGVQRTLAHLNEAWHCRRYDITRSTDLGCKMSNLKRWQKYPREFTRLMKGRK